MIAAQSALAFLWKCRKYWWVLLLLVIAAQAKQNNSLRKENAKLTGEGNIELKDDEGGRVIIGPNGTKSAVRDGDGVKHDNVYVPREGSTDVTVKMDPAVKAKLDALNDQLGKAKASGEVDQVEIDRLQKERDALEKRLIGVHVKVKTWGFTIRPGLGILYSNELYPEIDIKFFFWKRYSAKVGTTLKFFGKEKTTTNFFDIGISRHIDDLIPLRIKFRNLEIQIAYGFEYKDMKNRRLAIGGRLNL